jgi:hypothetical protein
VSLASVSGEVSGSSNTIGFTVGTQDIAKEKQAPPGVSDVNGDGKVNLVDFSVEAYWYKKANPPKAYDLNGDGKVNLIDFSIMASHWSG